MEEVDEPMQSFVPNKRAKPLKQLPSPEAIQEEEEEEKEVFRPLHQRQREHDKNHENPSNISPLQDDSRNVNYEDFDSLKDQSNSHHR